MANVKTFVAALGLAGALLAPASISHAQDYVGPVAVAIIPADCYYDLTLACRYGGGPLAAYAALGVNGNGPYASMVAPGYNAYGAYSAYVPRFRGPLRGGDWTSAHGANEGAAR